MKDRGLASPDDGDALALTLAFPVPEYQLPKEDTGGARNRFERREYDPYSELNKG